MAINIDRKSFQQLSRLEFLAKQAVEGFITGLHKSPFHGFSVEFAEHRLYNTGESTRHIDWKLYARTEKLFTKRYEEETNLRCQLVIDHSSSMYYPGPVSVESDAFNKLKFSVYAAAALLELFKKQRDAVGLSLFADTLDLHTQTRSNAQHQRYLYAQLEELLNTAGEQQQQRTLAVEALHAIADQVHRRSLVVIFSDMFDLGERSDALFAALQHLRHNKHEVILFHVVDKKTELDFEFDNRPYTFIDLETGQQVKANPADIRENYLTQMTKFYGDLKIRCGQYGIDFVEADIAGGVNPILLQYLIKRQKLY
jgi:uncharacterized protein (DUF58 family)